MTIQVDKKKCARQAQTTIDAPKGTESNICSGCKQYGGKAYPICIDFCNYYQTMKNMPSTEEQIKAMFASADPNEVARLQRIGLKKVREGAA